MKKINVQNDVESRLRIAEKFPKEDIVQKIVKKEVANAQSKEASESPVVETTEEPENQKKTRRKTQRNA